MVLLIGNYRPDQQQSMQRFETMMLEGLTAAGVSATAIRPEPFFGCAKFAGRFAQKWLAYLDKFVFFPKQLRRALRGISVVHICDHSNAMYAEHLGEMPVVVTCHDLLAVRGALGESTDCPATRTGVLLQRWIVRGLQRATAVACVSRATLRDAERLIPRSNGRPLLEEIANGLNFPYRQLPPAEAHARLAAIPGLDPAQPFVLHVGSNLRRKNREGVLRIFGLTREKWNGQLVFAGDRLTPELRSLGDQLGLADRIVEIEQPDSAILEALYSSALALLFPSRFEGFGWPIIEAQACGCPVLCANQPPMSEVGGAAALQRDLEDEQGFATDLLRLRDPAVRDDWSRRSLENADNFRADKMIARYVDLYRRIGSDRGSMSD